jgi:catechol 2,3-dioxygenase-like lactoylglutathione lyase family enzyme
MSMLRLEHANITVRDSDKTARFYEEVFDFHRRWEGPALAGGHTVHVGTDDSYVAFFAPPEIEGGSERTYLQPGLNHIGFVVDDLDEIERRLVERGVTTHNHADYEPGRRFYFDDPDGIEVEVVSYS